LTALQSLVLAEAVHFGLWAQAAQSLVVSESKITRRARHFAFALCAIERMVQTPSCTVFPPLVRKQQQQRTIPALETRTENRRLRNRNRRRRKKDSDE